MIVVGGQSSYITETTRTKINTYIKMYFAKGIGLIKTEVKESSGDYSTENVMDTFSFL